MTDDTFNEMLGRAAHTRITPPSIDDVTPWVLDDIRRSAVRREEVATWRLASSVAAVAAIAGLFAALPAWQRLDNPLADFASVLPGADQ